MDQSTAHALPDEFLSSSGTAIQRTLSLVFRHWRSYPIGEQRQLAQALVSLLEPLLAQQTRAVSDALRDECARTIRLWEDRKSDPRQFPGSRLATGDRSLGAHQDRSLPSRPARAIRFLRAALDHLPGERCRVRVELERGAGELYVGSTEAPYTHTEALRCAAHATAQAIHQAVAAAGDTLVVEDVRLDDLFGKQTVFVEVAAIYRGDHRQLLGFCRIDADAIRAASFAVLNATNRFLDLS